MNAQTAPAYSCNAKANVMKAAHATAKAGDKATAYKTRLAAALKAAWALKVFYAESGVFAKKRVAAVAVFNYKGKTVTRTTLVWREKNESAFRDGAVVSYELRSAYEWSIDFNGAKQIGCSDSFPYFINDGNKMMMQDFAAICGDYCIAKTRTIVASYKHWDAAGY